MSTAWDENGDVEKVFGTPWGGMRNALLRYKGAFTVLAKLTLNGITYDFQKQAKDGLVVCGYGYSTVAFFLPDSREPMTSLDGADMTLQSYFEMLATTDYAVITAWDYFAKYLSGLMSSMEDPNMEFAYTLIGPKDSPPTIHGSASFGSVTTAREFFGALANSMEENADPLSVWMAEDGAVCPSLSLTAGTETLSFDMIIGRK